MAVALYEKVNQDKGYSHLCLSLEVLGHRIVRPQASSMIRGWKINTSVSIFRVLGRTVSHPQKYLR